MLNRSHCLLAFLFFVCFFISNVSAQIYQKTHHDSPLSFDRYAQCESLTNPSNIVLIGKRDSHTPVGTMMSNPQVLEVDINGDVIIDNILINSTNEDLVYNHIESAYNGYVAVGYTKYNGYLTPIVTNFDHLLNIVNSVVIPAYEADAAGAYFSVDAIGMHITTNIASGYILSGFTGGIDPNMPHDRKAIAMELDFGLGIIWSRAFNSPIQTSSTDFDMFTHALTINNTINAGYFFSGSSNGSSVQEAAAVMLDLGGNVLWKKHYANNPGGGHMSVSGDAVYDSNTNLIHQLNNNTVTHCWGISAFDAITGIRDGVNSWGGSVANTYPNIEALSLEHSLIQDYLCVAGYQRDHSWVDADGVSYQGSVPFLAEVKKLGSIVWDKRYLIPNNRFLGGAPANDLLSTFTGQQTIIRHESMLTIGTSDYTLHTYRDISPYSSGLEVLRVMPDGSNLCESEPLGLSTQEENWFDEDTQVDSFVAFDPVNHVLTSTAGDVITESCGDPITNPCVLPAVSDIGFTYYDDSMNVLCLIGCAVGFTPPGLDPDLYCAYWDFGDGTTIGPIALADQTHCYNSSGNYTVCLSIVCCDDPDVAVTYCEDIEVVCGGAPCELSAEDLAPLEIIAFEDSPNGICCFGICPLLTPDSNSDLMSLCIDIDWGDDSAPILGQAFAACYEHCYGADGTYTITVTVYCCDNPDISFVLTETVSCGAPCEFDPEDLAPLEIIAFEDSPNGVCCFGVCPLITTGSDVDLMSLCIDIDWGDDSAPLLGQTFAACYEHCYGADGTYTISVTVYCCDNPEISYTLTETVSCGCVPECYVRSSFWANIIGAGFAGDCVTEFDASIFLGPNMISHQNPSWTIDGVPFSNDYVFATLLASGTYNVCHTIEGTLNDGTGCEFSSCRDVQVNCCSDSGVGCSDITGDGAVTIADLLQLLANFGSTC